MGIQTATTGQLENAQRIVVAKARFTAEHSMPTINLVEQMTLEDGAKSMTVPKVGQVSWSNLVDGVDMTDSADIGMTTTDLTSSEVGVKMILTDKLVRQQAESPFAMVGRQIGEGLGRKKDTDLLALLSALNGGTSLGAGSASLTLQNVGACIAFAKAQKFPSPVAIVHHPNALFDVVNNATLISSSNAPIPRGWSEDLLRDFYKFVLNQVAVFEDGNITEGTSSIGGIFSRNSMVYIEQKGFTTERERDASLRAWEVVAVTDYGVFELDDGYGAPMTYDSTAPSTSA